VSGTPTDTTAPVRPEPDERHGRDRLWRSRAWRIVGALSVTEVVSWGVVYYAFSVFLVPMRRELGYSTAELTGAFSAALLISAVAGVAVGRYLDAHSPRALMTGGSVAATVLVVAWSQVDGLLAYYAVWAGLGLVMAAILYEPAFVVLAKWFPDADERRRAMTALTLVAALASFIFLPLSQALVDARGWRDALLVLALILGVVTIPLHALVLRRAPSGTHEHRVRERSAEARAVLRSRGYLLLCAAFFLATATGIGMTVLTIPYLIGRGFAPGFSAFAAGLIGFSQIPGRILFARLGPRLRRATALAVVFGLIAAGIAVLQAAHAAAVIVGVVLLGMGNGMTTLARATIIADRYGAAIYGAVSGVAASATTSARAAGPVAAAAFAAATSYRTLLWTLAALALGAAALGYTAERPEIAEPVR
jgi:MFS family permease